MYSIKTRNEINTYKNIMKRLHLLVSIIIVSFFISHAAYAAEYFSVNVTAGTTGSAEVKKIQQFLKDQRLFSGPINGNYGPQTKKAVQDFQKREKIQPASGDWKVLTRGKANTLYESKKTAVSAPKPAVAGSTAIPTPSFIYPVKPIPQLDRSAHAIVDQNVPFVSQAPLGNWSDDRLKDGCEEASILMAVSWLRGDIPDGVNAERQIMAMADFETKRYGYHNDTSADDTAKLMKDYFFYNTRVAKSITTDDIIKEIAAGKIVILQVNGQKFNNPFYTGAGPERHTIVVGGYDYTSQEFIVNDPGITNGWSLRYTSAVLTNALQDYTSGVHLPLPVGKTAMIVVAK